jgi:plastocyanin
VSCGVRISCGRSVRGLILRLEVVARDADEHDVVTDTPSLAEFMRTGTLAPGGERSFIMNTTGTSRIHCRIHPQMVGTLVVQEQ